MKTKRKLKLKNKYEYLYIKLMPSARAIIVGHKIIHHGAMLFTNFGVCVD